MLRPFVLLLVALAGSYSATEAHAQRFMRRGPIATPAAPAATTYSSGYSGMTAPSSPGRVYSYSYYTRSALPARTYAGYATEDFAYHGRPYGHPYDPWTWPMMSGSYGRSLAHYNDPPVK